MMSHFDRKCSEASQYNFGHVKARHSCTAVRPDWAMFERFWRKLFLQKKPKHLTAFWAILKSVTLLVKIAVTTFGATFGEIWLLFIATSGHTAA